MVTLTQIILALVITSLTVMLVVIGIHIVKILQELRLTLQKFNRILDDTANLTHSVSQPIVSLSNLAEGFKGGVKLISLVKKLLGQEEPKTETPPPADPWLNSDTSDTDDELSYIHRLQEKGRDTAPQFFHRQGKPLG